MTMALSASVSGGTSFSFFLYVLMNWPIFSIVSGIALFFYLLEILAYEYVISSNYISYKYFLTGRTKAYKDININSIRFIEQSVKVSPSLLVIFDSNSKTHKKHIYFNQIDKKAMNAFKEFMINDGIQMNGF